MPENRKIQERVDDLATQDDVTTLLTQDRIDAFVPKLAVTLEPFADKQMKLGKAIARLVIKDQRSYDKANELTREIKQNLDDGSVVIDPLIAVANRFHKALTNLRKQVADSADQNKRALAAKLRVFDEAVAAEQARKDQEARAEAERREREARILQEKEAAERRRIAEAEAAERRKEEEAKARVAREASERAAKLRSEKARREAEEAQEAANAAELARQTAEADAEMMRESETMVKAATHDPIDVGHVRAAPVLDRAQGPTFVDNWKGRCTSPELLFRFVLGVPLEAPVAHPELMGLMQVNQSALDAIASAQKSNLSIPGCEPFNDRFMRGNKR